MSYVNDLQGFLERLADRSGAVIAANTKNVTNVLGALDGDGPSDGWLKELAQIPARNISALGETISDWRTTMAAVELELETTMAAVEPESGDDGS